MKEATKKQTSKAQPEGPQFTPQISTREERYYKHRAQRLICRLTDLALLLIAAIFQAFAILLVIGGDLTTQRGLTALVFEVLFFAFYKLSDLIEEVL